MAWTQTKKAAALVVGNDEGEVQINENEGGDIGINAPMFHQIAIQRNGYTAGAVAVTGIAAGSDVEEVVYDADGTTALVINLAAASYKTAVVGPLAYEKLIFNATGTGGTSDGWLPVVYSGNL